MSQFKVGDLVCLKNYPEEELNGHEAVISSVKDDQMYPYSIVFVEPVALRDDKINRLKMVKETEVEADQPEKETVSDINININTVTTADFSVKGKGNDYISVFLKQTNDNTNIKFEVYNGNIHGDVMNANMNAGKFLDFVKALNEMAELIEG